MKNRFYLWLAACLVLLMGISLSVHAKSVAADRGGFTEADAEFYMPEAVFGFFRPGVEIHLVSIEIPGDRQPVVTFDLTDPEGAPLDIDGVLTPGPISMYFMLDYIPQGEEKVVGYCPGSRFCYDRGGELTTLALGSYTYKFSTVLPEDYDADATHTLSSVARRRFGGEEFDGVEGLEPDYIANDIYNFIPSGQGTIVTRDIVTTETCNNCHNPLGEHGGSRFQEVRICLHCHNEDNVGEYALGPLVHRIHSSNEPEVGEVHYPAEINDCQVCHTGGTPTADMPLVANPNPVTSCGSGVGMTTLEWAADGSVEVRIGGAGGQLFAQAGASGSKDTGNWVKDGMDFFLLDRASGETLQQETVDLTVYGCAGNAPYTYGNPEGTVGAQHTNWMTNPNRAACGGCHVNIDFENGVGHPVQEDDELCSFCHAADSGEEFDRSVAGAHTVALASTVLQGVFVDIKEVTDTGPGQSPTVLFSLTGKSGPLDPSTLDRLLFVLSGPNEDFEFYAQENVLSGLSQVGSDWAYTFSAKVPMDAEGSYSVSFEGRVTTEVNGSNERDSAESSVVAVAVTDSEPMARDMIVDDAKCEACHSNLSLHGDNRKNATSYCQTCHMPAATDEEVRLEGKDESIHFKYMIHKIHRGAELENLPYIVYGYRSSVHDYSDVHYPGDLRDCEVCHVNDSYNLPLPEGRANTHAPSAFITDMGPETATCLSCHDSFTAAAHASANTGALGESCSACHGDGKTYSVERVHAR
jgi:formylmethanofuran dehydrogenase subunit E